MPSSRKRISVGALALAVAAGGISGLVAAPALANPAGSGLVINEVYGAGGNSGAVYNADFVELYNPTSSVIALTGVTIQYRSAAGGVGGTQALSGQVAAKGTYLIQMSSAGTTGAALPTPNLVASPSINLAAAGGQTILGTATTFGSGNLAGAANVIDALGASGATSFEGTAAGTASATQSLNRSATGNDTDVNSADFSLATPTPTRGDGTTPPVDPPPTTVTPIADIQGTNATASPLVGRTVLTQGVVTAAYPTGGFKGYYLQTAGTGSGTDQTPGASDAVFVFAPSLDAANFPAIGDSVELSGAVSEFGNLTEVTSSTFTAVSPSLPAVTPLAAAYPTTEADREAHEGELLAPTDTFTVSDTYSTNQYGEIGLATGSKPLVVPTEAADAQDAAAIANVTADNAKRGVILDDASSVNFLSNATNKAIPLPWLTKTKAVSVGATATFTSAVVLDYRNSAWKFQPRAQVTGDGADVATFSDFRAANAAPQNVGGNVKLATFNVLNYFPTTAESVGCTSTFKDRDGNPITADTCPDPGPRGAANDVNLQRQQAKIVTAINKLGADIVSLEEIENSVKFGKDRDDALGKLVTALNTAAGSSVWAFVPSPAATALPATSAQDVIRTAFIYKPTAIAPVGVSQVLDDPAFSNARQPLAQTFKRIGAPDSAAFAVIVNHFKSKGSGTDDGTGQGNANPDRIKQANALVTFADSFKAARNTAKVFLTGDFNAYSKEDPIQVLEAAGFTDLRGKFDPDESTYSFGGQVGSIDHVFANSAALGDVTDADVWNINSGESVAYEYSRYNYNATDFYTADQYRASDHDPEIVGLDEAGAVVHPSPTNSLVGISAPRTVNYGVQATVSATVVDASNNARIGGVPVVLYRYRVGDVGYVPVATVMTTANGTAAYTLAVGSNALFFWRFAGNAAHNAANSAVAPVFVVPTVTIAATSYAIRAGQSSQIYGDTAPATRWTVVYLQRLVNGRWTTLAWTTTKLQKLPNGMTSLGYLFTYRFTARANYELRVAQGVTAFSTSGVSESITVRVT